jgi:hypothetical protein
MMLQRSLERAAAIEEFDNRTDEGNPWFVPNRASEATLPPDAEVERTWGAFASTPEELEESLAELRIRQVAAPIVAPIFEGVIPSLRRLPHDEAHFFGGHIPTDEAKLDENPKAPPLPRRRVSQVAAPEASTELPPVTESTGYFEPVAPSPEVEEPVVRLEEPTLPPVPEV